jgi:BirA family biotin operon repressor/biotin-[acetyl-CoA-carboxylase] ligase
LTLPPELAAPLARAAGRLGPCAAGLRWYPEVGSTNDVALALAEHGADEGTVVVADAQTRGRGRLGRVWVSPPGAGVYASVILRPSDRATSLITLGTGVGLAEGVQAATGLVVHLKWPNDLFVSVDAGARGAGRKVAGILTERGSEPERSNWVVVGFGINVLPAAYPAEIAARATSLETELGRSVDRGLVLVECLAAVWARYRALEAGHAGDVLAAWRARAAASFGRPVEWEADGRLHRGVARDIESSGALVVGTDAGVRRIISGEVRWI